MLKDALLSYLLALFPQEKNAIRIEELGGECQEWRLVLDLDDPKYKEIMAVANAFCEGWHGHQNRGGGRYH